MVTHLLREFILAQNRLSTNFMPERLADAPADELPVFMLRLAPLIAELPQDPVNGKTGMGRLTAGRGPVAASLPGFGLLNHLRPNTSPAFSHPEIHFITAPNRSV